MLGRGASARPAAALVRRHGRYAQIGLQGKPITWDLDQICYKELAVSGSFATVPSAWRKALALLASGQVQTTPAGLAHLPLGQIRSARSRSLEGRTGLKVVLTPGIHVEDAEAAEKARESTRAGRR